MLFNRNDQKYIGASLRKYGEWSAGEVALFRQIALFAGNHVLEVGCEYRDPYG